MRVSVRCKYGKQVFCGQALVAESSMGIHERVATDLSLICLLQLATAPNRSHLYSNP